VDKIAAYEVALEQHAMEKRAEYLLENYGTCTGEMPEAYLQAFHELDKTAWGAVISNAGKALTSLGSKASGGLRGLGMKAGKGGQGVQMFGKNVSNKAIGGTIVGGGAATGLGGAYALGNKK